jgi:hypothetical protein
MAENTFPLAYVEAWAWRGACPPPLHGDPGSPISAFISMGLRDRWARDDAPLRVSDEEGVQRQRAVAESEIRRQLDQTVRWPGTDNLLFPEAQAAIKRLGCWVDPPDDHRGSHWSATRPQSWIWGASPHADTCRMVGFAGPRDKPSRTARLRSEIRLRQEADRFDRWLLLGVRRNDAD